MLKTHWGKAERCNSGTCSRKSALMEALREKGKAKKASPTDFYCRRFVREGKVEKSGFFALVSHSSPIEGNRVKYSNPDGAAAGIQGTNRSLQSGRKVWDLGLQGFHSRRANERASPGKRDRIPQISRVLQLPRIRLSADRTSIGPTPPEIRVAIEEQILEITKEIFEDEGVAALLESLDEADFGDRTAEQEKKDYARRVKQSRGAANASYKGIELREPQRELGVVAMLAQLLCVAPEIFPFRVLDWNNATGYDLLARDVSDLSYDDASKFYVECKQLLGGSFNHSLGNVKFIVCWDTDLENDSIVAAVGGDTRKMVIKAANADKPTQFFLSRDDAPNNIEVFVLKRLLSEKLRVSFK